MDKTREMEILIARIRQIHAADRNALDIYADLAQRCDEPDMKEQLRSIAQDEGRHVALDREMLALLEPPGPGK